MSNMMSEMDQLVERIGQYCDSNRMRAYRPASSETLAEIEHTFGLQLPDSYRRFCLHFGAISSPHLRILGFGPDVPAELSAGSAFIALSLLHPDLSTTLLPIEDLGDGRLVCLDCGDQGGERGSVVVVARQNDAVGETCVSPFSDGFGAYLSTRLAAATGRGSNPEVAQLAKRVREYAERFGSPYEANSKLPKSHHWRPYRYCVQDVVLGSIVLRHNRELNLLEVDVFLTAEHPDLPPYHGVRGLCALALTEAFHCGGTMDIQFTDSVQGGYVPQQLVDCSADLGVTISQGARGRITAQEARALYLELTPFSDDFREWLLEMDGKNALHSERACYMVHHSVWSPAELEAIIRSSPEPERVLSGGVSPLVRHLFLEDLLACRSALLGGLLDHKLAYRDEEINREDECRRLEVEYEAEHCAKIYLCNDEQLPVPWLVESEEIEIEPGHKLQVFVRARDSADIRLSWEDDLRCCHEFCNSVPRFLLYPHDFQLLDKALRGRIVETGRDLGIKMLVCPESSQSLDNSALQRLERSRITRQ